MKTLQEVFDLAVGELLRQGAISRGIPPSKSGCGRPTICLYRGPGGLKCPVGHVILDEFYAPELEGCEINEHPDDSPEPLVEALRRSGVPYEAFPMLTFVQDVHDSLELEVEDWPEAFHDIAESLGLKATVIDEFVSGEG